MSCVYEIVLFDATHRPPTKDLMDLHSELLPNSPITLLGSKFMQSFYYRLLPRKNHIFGSIVYVDQKPAGFIVATHDSSGFMRSALRYYGLSLVWILGLSILQEPITRLRAIWEALQIMKHRPPEVKESVSGAELLSFGVRGEYCSAQFIRQSGLQLSKELLHRTVAKLEAEGASEIRAIVDADNIPAKLFYHSLGWQLVRTDVPGWRIPSVEFLWQS
jgi:ribosomal protein S18 acetylase RimI-like enzyme